MPASHADRRPALFVGTYTEKLPHVDGTASGILRADHDGNGRLAEPAPVATVRNPSWVTVSDGVLYAVSETGSHDGQGSVAAFRIDPHRRALTPLGQQLSGGADPAHLRVLPGGRRLVVANYSGGSLALFALEEGTGRIMQQLDLVRHEGTGPDPDRQEGPHPHMVAVDPRTGDLLIPDLGTDAVWTYRIGQHPHGQDRLMPTGRIACPPGSGPRHLAFRPDGEEFYLVGELANTLTVFRRSGAGFTATEHLPLLPEDTPVHSQAAAVRVTRSGALVLVSNRGHDSITVFRNRPGDALRRVSNVSVRGAAPRDLAFTPDERYLLTANQDSRSVSVFRVHPDAPDDGLLRFEHTVPVPTPVCLAWF